PVHPAENRKESARRARLSSHGCAYARLSKRSEPAFWNSKSTADDGFVHPVRILRNSPARKVMTCSFCSGERTIICAAPGPSLQTSIPAKMRGAHGPEFQKCKAMLEQFVEVR